MDYLKLFQTHEEYEDFVSGGTMLKPNVSHCVSENEVHYNPHTFADEYFTTIAREDGTIDFTLFSWADTSYVETFAYSKNDGEWIETQNSDNREEDIVISVSVEEGDKVRWKGIANHIGDDGGNGGVFTSTCRFDAKGNIMSLLHGDDFKDKITLENGYEFSLLFHDMNNENGCLVVNASNLILPATTLAQYCYGGMFEDCTSLTTAPELPATILAESCYSNMFYHTNVLPGTNNIDFTSEQVVASGGLVGLFAGTNVTDNDLMRILPKNNNGKYCLPVTTLADFCYASMFGGCTSLTTAPELPATTLESGCYHYMFYNCTSLTVAPELPATTLAEGCYYCMFEDCTNLTVAPELPATTLESECYKFMFQNCTSINYIKAMFTTTPSDTYTSDWVNGVAASGTFVKNSAATWNVTGNNGIPTGWTVQTASA